MLFTHSQDHSIPALWSASAGFRGFVGSHNNSSRTSSRGTKGGIRPPILVCKWGGAPVLHLKLKHTKGASGQLPDGKLPPPPNEVGPYHFFTHQTCHLDSSKLTHGPKLAILARANFF